MHAETLDLRDVIVFLVAAGVVVPFVQRLKVSPVLGFLFVGVIIGPYGLARFEETVPWFSYAAITDLEGVSALAELGVVFLLFMIGLELSFERLWSLRHAVFGLGGAQVAVTGVAIGSVAYLFNNPLPTAVVLGACFALSSTAIVMQLLAEKRRLGTPVGRTSFAILLFQDLAVVPILFMVGVFAAHGEGSVIVAFAAALGQAVMAVAAILLIGRLVIRPLFRIVGSSASRELFVATVLLVIIGTAITTNAVGMSMALGAFLAGLMFSETEYRHEITVDIQPFRGLLLGLFFVSVGMGIDMAEVAARPLWLASSVVGLFMIKGVILYVLARFSGHSQAVSLETSILLGQGGEFAFVVLGMAAALGLMPRDVAQFMLIVTGLTTADVWPFLNEPERWPTYYANSADVRFYDGKGPALEPGLRFYFSTFGFPVEAQVVEHTPPVEGQPARVAWHGWAGEVGAQDRLDVHHAWLIEDLSGGRVRILTQETQNGNPAKDLAKANPNPMINGHQDWLNGLVAAARAAKA